MHIRIKQILIVLFLTCLIVFPNGCSVFISTPRTARIHIQGLGNEYYDYIITLDQPLPEANLDIRISDRYAVQIDFEWLWDAYNNDQADSNALQVEDQIVPLVPWMQCKYRF